MKHLVFFFTRFFFIVCKFGFFFSVTDWNIERTFQFNCGYQGLVDQTQNQNFIHTRLIDTCILANIFVVFHLTHFTCSSNVGISRSATLLLLKYRLNSKLIIGLSTCTFCTASFIKYEFVKGYRCTERCHLQYLRGRREKCTNNVLGETSTFVKNHALKYIKYKLMVEPEFVFVLRLVSRIF